MPAAPRGRRAAVTYAGVFALAMSTLMLEVLLTRIASVIAWYHLAFFVISLGMLGMTAGAVMVFVLPHVFPAARLAERTGQAALGFTLSIPASVGLTMAFPLAPVTDFMTFIALLATGTFLAVPFILGGIALTLALTRSGLPTNRVYGVDLTGAALGCVAVIPVLNRMDAPSAALVSAAVAGLAALCFADSAGTARLRPALATLALAAGAWLNSSAATPPFRPLWVKGMFEDPAQYTDLVWNTYSRVTVEHPFEQTPPFWAKGSRTPQAVLSPVSQRFIRIDGAAGTMMTAIGAGPSAHGYLEWDLSAVAHRLRPTGPAAVIGVGGGRDVLAALQAGHAPVVGVELNEQIVDLHRGPYRSFTGLVDSPNVELVSDEARSYMARSRAEFDVITMSLIDTWASTGAGAYSLSENGLYTREAWELFLDRLTATGLFSVSRWYVAQAPGETARMLALAMEVLYERKVSEPANHMLLLQSGLVATLLVSPSPLTPQDVGRARTEAGERGFNLLFGPGIAPASPLLAELSRLDGRQALWRWARSQPLDITPPTDDRPFFFNMLKPSTWLRAPREVHRLDLPVLGNLQATQTLLYATVVSVVLTLATLVGPALRRRRDLSVFGPGQLVGAGGYFALIGLGFMFVEMGMLSRLNVFLGHPTLALSVLLSSLIFFTGVGSLLSGRIPERHPLWMRWYPLLPTSLVLATHAVVEPSMVAFQGAPTPTRVLVSIGLIAPVAVSLGLCFPVGLRLVERMELELRRGQELRRENVAVNPLGPWLWGINGACSVCASGLSLGISMIWGISTTLLLGALCYALLIPCTLKLFSAGVSTAHDSPRSALKPGSACAAQQPYPPL